MFTGIVAGCGDISAVDEGKGRRSFRIKTRVLDFMRISLGASIACDGCCLTVIAKGTEHFVVDAVSETLAVTNLGTWKTGSRINLEPSLRMGDEMGGHIVTGHIDGLATVESIQPDGDAWRFKLSVPQELAKYIAPKGSVTLNGISLTVNEVEGNVFGVCIIPHTWGLTNISDWKQGMKINLEVDTLARYVDRLLAAQKA